MAVGLFEPAYRIAASSSSYSSWFQFFPSCRHDKENSAPPPRNKIDREACSRERHEGECKITRAHLDFRGENRKEREREIEFNLYYFGETSRNKIVVYPGRNVCHVNLNTWKKLIFFTLDIVQYRLFFWTDVECWRITITLFLSARADWRLN